MKRLIEALCFIVPLAAFATTGQIPFVDPGWPRQYANGTAELRVYQPQVDGWSDFKNLRGRCAFELRPSRDRDPLLGTFRFQAETLVDTDRKIVLLRNIHISDLRFPSVASGSSSPLAGLTKSLLPSDAIVVALDRVLAFVHAGEVPRKEARVLTDPPPIFLSTTPAVLVIVDGEPVMLDIENTKLRRVVNTNWTLIQDSRTGAFYLRHQGSWLSSSDLRGTFAPAAVLPPDMERSPAENAEVQKSAGTPRVFVVNRPSELIVLNGAPALVAVGSTQLSAVTNTESDLFFHSGTRTYYYLASGRWFQSPVLEGPWRYASAMLPEEFRRIPPDHAKAHVLAAVPGTREAEDAILLAAIPRTAEIRRSAAKAEVQYVGAPDFVPIQGTSISYARNTPGDVLRVGDLYYLCFQGVWFVSASANGPWQAADRVPDAIYSIPESSPKYNVTYVKVYESTPSTIIVGYTPGYYGSYVSGGVVVWGTGYYYPPYVAVSVASAPVYWGASCYTWGASAWYNPATGLYARGSAVYGPYGGFGAASAYNPRTGTYAQGAAAWGPNGGVAAARTYNPVTRSYSAGYHAANPYGSWGEGVVSNGSNWARGGYQSNSKGTVAAGQTSQGGVGLAAQGANGNSGYLARSGSGDLYAGANGNVYKRDNGQWYQNRNGSWTAIDRSALESQRQQAAARDRGTYNTQLSERWRSSGGAASRAQGFEQRPRFQGRRR